MSKKHDNSITIEDVTYILNQTIYIKHSIL